MDSFEDKYPPDPTQDRTTLLKYSYSYRDEAYLYAHWVNGFVPYDVANRKFDKQKLPPKTERRWGHHLTGYFMSKPESAESPALQAKKMRAAFEKKLAELQADGWTVVDQPDVIGATLIYLTRPKNL